MTSLRRAWTIERGPPPTQKLMHSYMQGPVSDPQHGISFWAMEMLQSFLKLTAVVTQQLQEHTKSPSVELGLVVMHTWNPSIVSSRPVWST